MSQSAIEKLDMRDKNKEKSRTLMGRWKAHLLRMQIQLDKQSPHGTPKRKKDGKESGKDTSRRNMDGE